MPFHGVLPERRHLFQPEPRSDVGVNDTEAWRLNPGHRHVYNKLELALWQGLKAAPCGVDPIPQGMAPNDTVFVKPITNLAGMSLNARSVPASAVPKEPGSFWCEQLKGTQTSSDCLVLKGRPIWFAHTRAAEEKNKNRPIYWEIGVDLPENEAIIDKLITDQLQEYTGLINVEIIDGYIIEAHLRGSNAFFDFYGEQFLPAWVELLDKGVAKPPPDIPGGVVYSVFSEQKPGSGWQTNWPFPEVSLQLDHQTPDRLCILRGQDLRRVSSAARWIQRQ